MASARAELKTVISADSSQFSSAMRRAGSVANDTGSRIRKAFSGKVAGAITAAGAAVAASFTVSTFAAGIKGAADLGGKLSDLSARTGIAAGDLARLSRAFEDNGVSADKIGSVINKLQKTIFEFGEGAKGPTEAFSALGISFDEISRLSPEQQFAMVQRAIAGIEDPAMRAAMAMKLFGKSGGELLTLFSDEGALEKAGTFLGTAAEILNRRAGTFDEISDILGRAGAKLQSFFIGVLDVVADDLLKILQDFDQLDLAKMGQEFAAIFEGINFDEIDIGGTIYQALESIKQVADWTYKLFQLFDKIGTLIGVMFASAFSPEVWAARFDFLKTGFRVVIEVLAQALGNLFSGETFKKLIMGGLSGKSPFELLGDAVGDAFNNVNLDDSLKTAYATAVDANKAIGQDMKDKLADVFSPLKDIGDIVPKKDPTAKPAEVEIAGPPKPAATSTTSEPSPETAGGLTFGNKVVSGKKEGGSWKDRLRKAVDKVNAENAKIAEKENKKTAPKGFEPIAIPKPNAELPMANAANEPQSMFGSGGLSVDFAKRGVATGLTTGGLGEKRRLATSKDQREAKKALSAQEAQLDKLSSIDTNIKQALTVS